MMVECWALEKKNVKKSNALVIPQDPGTPAVQPASSRDQYNLFISKGVSLSEHGENIPIDILKDTGATQSFVSEWHFAPVRQHSYWYCADPRY